MPITDRQKEIMQNLIDTLRDLEAGIFTHNPTSDHYTHIVDAAVTEFDLQYRTIGKSYLERGKQKNSFLGVIKTGDILYLHDDEYLEFLKANEGREVMVTLQPIELPFTETGVED